MANLLTDALKVLPHGPEFRFLDRLLSLTPGLSGVGEYKVRGTEPFLKGHFPHNPLFPGVLLVEAAAQLVGVIAQSDPKLPVLDELKLTALRSVKIYGTAYPNEVLEVRAELVGRMGNLVQATAQGFVNGNLVLKAELTLSGSNHGV